MEPVQGYAKFPVLTSEIRKLRHSTRQRMESKLFGNFIIFKMNCAKKNLERIIEMIWMNMGKSCATMNAPTFFMRSRQINDLVQQKV